MDDLFKIIRLLEVRIDDLHATSAIQIAVGDRKLRALYLAQARALEAFMHDLTATLVPSGQEAVDHDARSAIIVEVGGHYTATVVDNWDRDAVVRRFSSEHRAMLEDGGHAKCRTWSVMVPAPDPRTAWKRTGLIDMRHALITDLDGDLRMTIYNSEGELDEAIDEFVREHGDLGDDHWACCYPLLVVIPPRGSGYGTGPSGPY